MTEETEEQMEEVYICPYCDEMFDDFDEFFYHCTICEAQHVKENR